MAQDKVLILRAEDAVRYLDPVQKQQLIHIMQTINAGRARAAKDEAIKTAVSTLPPPSALQ